MAAFNGSNVAYGDNIDKVIQALLNKDKVAVEAGKFGLLSGLRRFESKITKEQMSGRNGSDMGLNVGSGELRRSWFINSRGDALDFIGTLATRSVYARVHQFGAAIKPVNADYLKFQIGGKWIQTKEVVIPKRLTILEDFRKSGIKLVKEEVRDALVAAYKKRG